MQSLNIHVNIYISCEHLLYMEFSSDVSVNIFK